MVSGARGFWIGNLILMAGVPSITQAMLDEVAPKLKIGVPMLSETVRADARESDIRIPILRSQSAAIHFRSAARRQHECGAARPRPVEARAARREVEDMLERVRRAQSNS
jgi:molybdopterin-biosynthesis enzyme MoeA-like protein